MKLHVDLETFELIEGPGFRNPVNSLRFKRGDAAKLEVVFLRSGTTPEAIGNPAQLELRFGVKPRNRYDVGYLVHTSSWTLPAPGAESPTYQCSPSFNTEELNSALNLGSATASELSEITLMGEITWREGIAEPTSTRTFLVVVENDVNRGDEGFPESAEPAYPAPSSIELVARKGMPHGYAELDSSGAVPVSQLPQSVELTSHKGQPHGYAELDENGLVPASRLPSIQGMHGIQITEHGVAVGMSSYAYGTATVVGTLASGYGVSIGYAAASHGEAVALGNYAMAYNHGIALGMGARTEGNKCIAIGNGAITGDLLHGYGRLEIAPYGSTGPRLSGHIWGGANVMQFSVTDGHGFSPSALHGGAAFNHAPGTIPSGMMMFAFSALNGSLTIYVNSAGTLKTATIPMT